MIKNMKKSFKVFAPKWSYKLALAGFLIFVLIPVLFCLIDGSSPIWIIVFAVLCSPFLVAALWGYWFRVIVREDTITVRQGIGKEYSFNVNEITKVVRRCFLASNFPHFHRYDSLKSALYIHAVSKNINTFPKNQGRIRAAIAVEILDFTVMYR